MVDGVAVNKDNYKDYQAVINKIEDSWKESINNASKKKEESFYLLQLKQELMKEKQLQLQDAAISLQENQLGLQDKEKVEAQLDELKLIESDMQNKNQILLENKLNLNNNINLQKLEVLKNQQLNLRNQLVLEKKLNLQKNLQFKNNLELVKNNQLVLQKLSLQNDLAPLKLALPAASGNDITEIINDLVEAGVVTDKDKLSFTLNYNELVVNGKKQDKNLHSTLKEKYIHSKKDHYIFKTNGHSTSTDIVNE